MNETAITVIPDKAEKKQIRAYYNKAAAAMVIFAILYLVIQIFVGFVDTTTVDPTFLRIINLLLITTIEIAAIAGGCFFTGLDWKSFFKSRDGYNGKTILKAYITAQGLGYIAAFAGLFVLFIMEIFGAQTDIPTPTTGEGQGASVVMVFYGVLFAPILEEILCRGVILGGLKKYNKTLALVVSAFAFGLIHGNLFQFSYAVVMGLVLGFVALKANSVIPSIFTHMAVNATAFGIQAILSLTGFNEFIDKIDNINDIGKLTTEMTEFLPSIIAVELVLLLYMGGMIITAITLAVLGRKQFRKYCPKANALGKSRGLPIFITSPAWIIVLFYHIGIVFIMPFFATAT
jgi:membrane protease YdiL (CAAX protease family)